LKEKDTFSIWNNIETGAEDEEWWKMPGRFVDDMRESVFFMFMPYNKCSKKAYFGGHGKKPTLYFNRP